MTRQSPFLGLAFACVLVYDIRADEPEVDPNELPGIPAVEPADALATFEMRDGFVLKIAACEPRVTDPIAIAFDAEGRLHVVEMRDYPERREEALGRIRLLEDTDDDGVFEQSTIFAKDLKWPTSVTSYDGGVFAVVTPDILYLKDTDGDGIADAREVVFTGLAEGVPLAKLNMEGLANGLQWGPDNRIWGSSSTSGGILRRPDQTLEEGINLAGQDFSFDPKTRALRAENGGGQNGMSFDLAGRRFLTSNSRHLMSMRWEKSWTRPSPVAPLPAPLVSIAVDGDAAPVFRISPDEPWRIVRTRWRVAGVVGGPVEGGGRVSGYFTGASGVTIHKGDAYGPGFVGNAFVADVGSNLVHRKVIRPANGGKAVALEAERPEDERDHEFLASRDNWFRPTNFANAPDGCLYVVDMYREVVEHPWSLPEAIKKHLDLNSGMDRGRIYRVEPQGFERRATPRLSALANDELALLLAHPNGWHRETAQRLLWERGDDRAGEGWARAPEPGSAFERFRELLERAVEREEGHWEKAVALADAEPHDSWLDAALLNGLGDAFEAVDLWNATVKVGKGGRALGGPLAELIARIGDIADARAVLESDPVPDRVADRILTAHALARGFVDSGRWSVEVRELFEQQGLPALADALAHDPAAEETARAAAIHLCGILGKVGEVVDLLGRDQTVGVKLAVLEALRGEHGSAFHGNVIAEWGSLDSRSRAAAFETLNADKEGKGVRALLEAIKAGPFKADSLPAGAAAKLRNHLQAEVRTLAADVLPEARIETREAVIARFATALTRKGDVEQGAMNFQQLCSGCHRAGGKGFAAGPDGESFQGAGRESILTNILDPNRQVAPPFIVYTVTLRNGEILAGLLANESATALSVRQPFGIERTIPRPEVAGMESAGHSLMPQGLEAALTPDGMADLLAYIESL